jgi:hypothetical protein
MNNTEFFFRFFNADDFYDYRTLRVRSKIKRGRVSNVAQIG